MRELTPVRLTERGTLLVLVDASGTEYVVATDARLRDTLGRATAAAPSLPPATSSTGREVIEMDLRPREIQDRIRAGESVADLAAVAGAPEEKVMAFAGPVLAERAHVADTALNASLRRLSGDGTSGGDGTRTLGGAADSRLRAEGADREALTWDAWRREDGRWTVEARYRIDGEQQRARFSYDVRGRFVTAEDVEARWLVGDGVFPSREEKEQARRLRLAPDPADPAPADEGRRATNGVDGHDLDQPFDIEGMALDADFGAALGRIGSPDPEVGEDVMEMLGHEGAGAPATEEVAATAAAVRGARIPQQKSRAPAPAAEPGPVEPVNPTEPVEVGLDALIGEPEAADREDTAALARRHPRKQRGRASVPSWDEIMFGGAD